MLSVDTSVSIISVFLQGLLSFFSPCIFPLIPLYMGYLAGGIKKQEDGKLHYNKIKAITNTIAFVLGISFTFLLLGLGATSFGTLLNHNNCCGRYNYRHFWIVSAWYFWNKHDFNERTKVAN